MNSRETLFINESGILNIGGVTATDLVKQFGTPIYVIKKCNSSLKRGLFS